MDIQQSLQKLTKWVEERDYTGFDIYDGLKITNSQKILHNKFVNIFITQFFKHNPINLRKLVGIKKTKMPKGVGLFLQGYVLLNKSDEGNLKKAEILKNWLLKNTAKGYSGICWNFGFNYKFMFDMPTVVITAIIAKGLFEYYRLTKCEETKDVLRSICDFILKDLPITETNDGINFCYTPQKEIANICCYNASMLGAEILAKVYSITGEEELIDYAKKAVDFTLAHQHEDGRWNYSIDINTGKERAQVDFHQGYVLESLAEFMKYSKINDDKYEIALKKGLEFYRNEQFFDSGRSKWRLPKVYPVDIHNQAQGIITFSKLSYVNPDYYDFAVKIAEWTIKNMQDKTGYFYYQKHKYYTNKIPYMRWAQAWMFLALANLIASERNI